MLVLSMVAEMDLELDQMDVTTAFLHGELEETIYMKQPPGFEKGAEDKVCLLRKSLYGLRQAPRQWNKRFDQFMVSIGFKKSKYDNCVYLNGKSSWNSKIILLLYVDDILIVAKRRDLVDELKDKLKSEFEMKDMGQASKILGIEITRHRKAREVILSQHRYLSKVLEKYGMLEAKAVTSPLGAQFKLKSDQSPKSKEECEEMQVLPYANVIGSIMYAMVCTRPDLAFALSILSRFMGNPGKTHWQAAKWFLRYVKGSLHTRLVYRQSDEDVMIRGYVDSDYAGCSDTRKSTTGYVFTCFGGAISWKSRLQKVVALSSTEAEFIAATEAVKESIWLKGFVHELLDEEKVITVYCDNQSAIHLTKNPMFHERSKHIDVRLHFIRDIVARNEVCMEKIGTEDNPADVMTKVLPMSKFRYCLELVQLEHGRAPALLF
ncbi:hypothetical protein CASFOL_022033 [Castilleja foliolosa]|uniref:Reverse transcriptase Ty1/copia-type domain-containing protein n=1 Tax=Castilleja foliolosa TaxID=1961234 RepID=A0ABD3CZL1_9LAMI